MTQNRYLIPVAIFFLLLTATIFVSSSSAQPPIEWERRELRLPESSFTLYSRDITVGPDGTIWLAVNGRWVGRSTNGGETWDTLGNGLWRQSYIETVFVSRNGTLYAGGSQGLARSTDKGATFTVIAAENSNVEDIVEGDNGLMYIATLGGLDGVYRSFDSGHTWARTSLSGSDVYNGVTSLAIGPDGALFASTHKGFFVSRDSARTFSLAVDSATIGSDIYTVRCAPNGTLFAGGNRGMFRSQDSGRTWLRCSPTSDMMTPLLITPEGHVFAVILQKGLYRSVDDGATWQPVNGNAIPAQISKDLSHLALAPDGRLWGIGLWQYLYRTLNPTTAVKEIRSDLRLHRTMNLE